MDEDTTYKAKLAEQAERYEEMMALMKHLCETKKEELTTEERNLLSIAFKNVVGERRTSWRTVYTIESKERQRGESLLDQGNAELARKHEHKVTICREYRAKIERELNGVCKDMLQLVTAHLIPTASPAVAGSILKIVDTIAPQRHKERTVESMEKDIEAQLSDVEQKQAILSKVQNGEALAFFFKLLGDYYRYLAEFSVESEPERNLASARSLAGYYIATEIARTHLKPTDPIRLGLALNYAVFYYEIMAQPNRACQLAKNAFDQAIAELDQLSQDCYKDSTLIMQLLRDNLTLWTSDMNDSAADDALH